MINRQLNSTEIGKCLLKKAGNAISSMFYLKTANRTFAPGDVLQVDAPPSLGCSKLFFIECSPWDGVSGWSVQVQFKAYMESLTKQKWICTAGHIFHLKALMRLHPFERKYTNRHSSFEKNIKISLREKLWSCLSWLNCIFKSYKLQNIGYMVLCLTQGFSSCSE